MYRIILKTYAYSMALCSQKCYLLPLLTHIDWDGRKVLFHNGSSKWDTVAAHKEKN